jgi:hypothetical protein
MAGHARPDWCECEIEPCAFKVALPERARTVIVGSSSSVMDRPLGHAIDQNFDTIVRANCAPVRGFEPYVGSRTSFRVVNQHIWTKPMDSLEAIVVAPPVHADPSRSYESYVAQARRTARHCGKEQPPALIGYDLLQRVRREFGVMHPTSGFSAIALFSHMFTSPVSLHGFSFFANKTKHYWTNSHRNDSCGRRGHAIFEASARANAFHYHDAALEARWVATFVQRGVLKFLQNDSSAAASNELRPRHACLSACVRTRFSVLASAGQHWPSESCTDISSTVGPRPIAPRGAGFAMCANPGAFCCQRPKLDCALVHPFRPLGVQPPLTGAVGGLRVVLVGLRTKNMRQLNGSLGYLLKDVDNVSGLLPVRILSSARDLSPEHLAATWMLKPRNLRAGSGATPDEVQSCLGHEPATTPIR